MRQRKSLFADDRRNSNGDPFLSRPLVARAVTRGDATTQPYRPRDALARRNHRFAKAGLPFVRRIAQHAPDRRALPAATLLARGDCLFVQQAGDGANAETLNAIQFEHPTHYASLLFVDLEARSGVICLANKPISERSAAQYANFSLAGAMSFAAARAFQNLRAFVLRDHVARARRPSARLSGILTVIVTEFSAADGAGVPARASSR